MKVAKEPHCLHHVLQTHIIVINKGEIVIKRNEFFIKLNNQIHIAISDKTFDSFILSRVGVRAKPTDGVFGLNDWIYRHLTQTTRDYRQYSVTADLHIVKFIVTYTLGFSLLVVSWQRIYNSLNVN
jgi:hypothetical protein